MKTLGYSFTFGLIGCIIGLLAGAGQTNYVKKSQRGFAFPMYAIGGAVIGIIGGAALGSNIGTEIEKEEKLGLDKQETFKNKVGRKWEYTTTFINPETGNKNIIKTAYSLQHDSVITFFNNNPILDHDSKSGADDKIYKNHLNGSTHVRQKLKASQLNLI